jgi:site-specific recombinase XerD
MASINKNIGKQGYVIQIRDLGLNTTLRTTIDNKVQANVKLREINTRMDILRKDRNHKFYSWAIEDRREYAKHGIVPAVEKEKEEPLSLVDAKAIFLQRFKGAESTYKSYEIYMGRLIRFLDRRGIRAMESVTSKDVQDFLDDYMETPIKSGRNRGELPKPASQRKYIDHNKMLWKHHADFGVPNIFPSIFAPVETGLLAATKLDGVVEWDDFAERTRHLEKIGIPLTTRDAYQKIIFTLEQLNELRHHLQGKLWDSQDSTLKNKRLFAALTLCMFTGVRRSELPRVRKQDVNIEYEEIIVLRMKGRGKKEFDRLRVTVHPIAMGFIEQVIGMIPTDQRSVFCDDDNHLNGESFRETPNKSKADTLSKRYKAALKGTKWQNAHGYHKFRHSVASVLMANGATKEQVKEAIGWSDDKMYERYKHLATSRQRSIIEQAFPVEESLQFVQ